jgi:UDP-glucose 4-epimerase
MNTIVTGGAGFIGSHLVRALLARGDSVLVIDNLTTGKIENLPDKNLLISDSLSNVSRLVTLFYNRDVVFHLAAIASVPQSMENPNLSFQVNINTTLNVLEAARQANVKKVVFASSCAIYGDSELMTETDIPHPQSPYAFGKLIGEQLCQAYTEIYSLPTVCLRYFNVYGERQALNSQYALAVPKFIDCAKKDLPIPIYGTGEQTRDYIFVDDVAEATIFAANKLTGIYNAGSGKSISINELAKTIIKIAKSKSVLDYQEARQGDPLHARANMNKIKKRGFTPEWSLKAGLRRMIRGLDR